MARNGTNTRMRSEEDPATGGREAPSAERQLADYCDDREAVALKLWTTMARAHNAMAAHDQRNLLKHKLTRGEFGVLDALFFKGPLLLGELQRKILVSSGGVTFLVDRLEKKGYLERRRSPEDRRAIYAALTPAGEEFYKTIFPAHAAGAEAAISVLSHEEREELIRLLRKVGKGAEALLG
ncbi:MAG: MarR family transcriptional regulator [Deltaproteobacteria bacterium]|nr:MarR family transcriptional regulator [Deltaproteobacteria bacterium]